MNRQSDSRRSCALRPTTNSRAWGGLDCHWTGGPWPLPTRLASTPWPPLQQSTARTAPPSPHRRSRSLPPMSALQFLLILANGSLWGQQVSRYYFSIPSTVTSEKPTRTLTRRMATNLPFGLMIWLSSEHPTCSYDPVRYPSYT